MKPMIGDTVEVRKTSDGNGKLYKSNPTLDTVNAVYLDGRVRVTSGDVWVVVPHKEQSKAKFAAIH